MKIRFSASFLVAALILSRAWADEADDASQMGQGEAAIQVRSDVKVAIAGTGGTPKARLEALSSVLAKAVPGVRDCYGKLVRKRASVVGAVRVTVRLNEGTAPPQLSLEEREPVPEAVRTCVTKALAAANYKGVPRPAAAVITLSLDNSRAEGQAVVEEKTEALAQIGATTSPDGAMEASWATEDLAVTFAVRARGTRAEAAAVGAIGALRVAYAGFMDCRRKCEKGGISPAGSAVVKVVPRLDSVSVDVLRTDIAHERAPKCLARAFKKTTFDSSPRGVPVEVTVTFAK